MKFLKRLGYILVGVILLINLFILISGRTYLYKGVWHTYLHGRTSASIDEYVVFDNRVIEAGIPDPWPISTRINRKAIPDKAFKDWEGWQTIAWLVVKDDSIIHESYWQDYSDTSHTGSFSMAKSFISILTGIAISDGKIKSVDQPVGDFLPEYAQGEKAKITIRHLLTMSSGIGFNESYKDPLGFAAEAYYGSDLRKLIFRYDVVKEPGKDFEYLSGNTQLLSFVLKAATGMTISEYASEKLWKQIGASHDAFWSLDHENGDEKAYCCFNSNARDFARIGQLYLDSGRWKGSQIVPENFVLESVRPAPLVDVDLGSNNLRYGFSWWLTPRYEYPTGSGKLHDIFYARGILGQYIIVVPDKKMVIVRLGRQRSGDRIAGHPADYFSFVNTAFDLYGD